MQITFFPPKKSVTDNYLHEAYISDETVPILS
jgi:hypothetical protein